MDAAGERGGSDFASGMADEIPDARLAELRRQLLERARSADESGDEGEAKALLDARWILTAYAALRTRNEDLQTSEAGIAGRFVHDEILIREQKHRHRSEFLRSFIALVLVAALFVVVIFGVFTNQNSETITQAAAPIAGLAGIAVGWLFGGQRGASE